MMSYVSYYLIGFAGAATIFASSFSAVMRVWDGVMDPLIGLILDKTDGRFGKNRPFMLIGNLILCAASYILFHVTDRLPEAVKIPFFVAVALLYYIGYTCQGVVTKSAQTCMTNDPAQRPKFGMFLNIFNTLFGLLFTVYLSGVLVPKYGSMYELGLFHELWVFVAAISGILTIIAAVSIAPKDQHAYFGTGKPQVIRIKDYTDVIKHNRAIQMLVISASTDKLAQAAKTSAATVVLYGIVVGNYALNGGFIVAPENIILTGDSAGGNLILALVMKLRDEGRALPRAVAAMAPLGDFGMWGASCSFNLFRDMVLGKPKDYLPMDVNERYPGRPLYAGDEDINDPYLSPACGEFTRFPPMLLQTGTYDLLLSDTLLIAEKMKRANREVRVVLAGRMGHVYQFGPGMVRECRDAWKEIEQFIKRQFEAGINPARRC